MDSEKATSLIAGCGRYFSMTVPAAVHSLCLYVFVLRQPAAYRLPPICLCRCRVPTDPDSREKISILPFNEPSLVRLALDVVD